MASFLYPNIQRINPSPWELHQLYEKSQQLFKKQLWSESSVLLYYIHQHTPHFKKILYQLGIAQIYLSYWQGAQYCFEELRKTNPWDPDIISNLAIIYWKQKKLKLALSFFKFNLKNHPHHLETIVNLASLYVEYNHLPKAIQQFNRILYRFPKRLDTRFNLAACLQKLGFFNDAIFHYRIILQENPNHYDSLYNLACLYWRQKDVKAARFYFEKAQGIHYSTSINFILDSMLDSQENFVHHQDYVKNLFNHYANDYDNHLLKELHYQIPHFLSDYLSEKSYQSSLEIGCGTGLCGPIIKKISLELIGVDLSREMIEKAKNKNCYSELHIADAIDFLEHQQQPIDCLFALDVSPYLLDFQKIFEFNHIQEMIFTIEISDAYPKNFQTNGRLSFHPIFIENICQNFKYYIVHQKKLASRLQHQLFCDLMFYHIKKE